MLRLGNLTMQTIKRLLYCVIVALIAISCDENNNPWGNSSSGASVIIPKTCLAQTPIPDSKSRAIGEAQAESWDDQEKPDTRTYAVVDPDNASEYFQYWSVGDAISLFLTTQNLQYKMQSYKDGTQDVGVFELVGAAVQGTALNSGGFYYSVYPYKESTSISKKGKITYNFPEIQHYNGDSYANGENGMVAIEPIEETDSILYFQNFCSYLQLRLVADENIKSVKKITLTANDNTNTMAGEGTVEVGYDTPPVVEIEMKRGASNHLVLDCGSGVELSKDVNNPSRFWFVLPGDFTFTKGFKITVIFNDYSYFTQSTSKQISIARSHIKPMATFKPVSLESNGPIRYKYNDTGINEPYPLKNTFYGENGEQLDIVDQVYDETTGEWVVLLSGTLKAIGDNSFEGPGPDIEYIKIDNEESIDINNFAFYNCTADFIEINNDVEDICESAFTGSTVKDLNINGNVTSIKNSAGTGSSIENIKITGEVETFEEKAFSGCSKLKTVDVSNVKEFGIEAFSGCTALQIVNVGNVESIGYRAFYMCSNLTNVNIPGVKNLGMGAFRSCTSLETITLESVITIDDNAFMDCSKLTSAVISENCTMIGEGAFCNAVSLKTVYCYAVYPPFIKTDNYNSSYVFDNVHKDICIYIPMGSEDYYIDDEIFEGQIFEDENIEAEVNWWYEEYEDILQEMEN